MNRISVYVRICPPRVSDSSMVTRCARSTDNHESYSENGNRELDMLVVTPGGSERTFFLDKIFDATSTQQHVYTTAVAPIVVGFIHEGLNGAIIAYGQTGTGKTYTVHGNSSSLGSNGREELKGIIPRAITTLFQHSAFVSPKQNSFQLTVSMLEIYNEKLFDLLNKSNSNLRIRESEIRGGVYVEHLTERCVFSSAELMEALEFGQAQRKISATGLNIESSRSHVVVCLKVEQRENGRNAGKIGKLYIVDLAGSENITRAKTKGNALYETKMINKSLAALGNVIFALAVPHSTRKHIPYRDSKLTRVLQDALGGKSKTCLICTISPHKQDTAETLSTLRFGQRAMLVCNLPVVHQARCAAQTNILQQTRLLQKLESQEQKIQFLQHALQRLSGARPHQEPDVDDNTQPSITPSIPPPEPAPGPYAGPIGEKSDAFYNSAPKECFSTTCRSASSLEEMKSGICVECGESPRTPMKTPVSVCNLGFVVIPSAAGEKTDTSLEQSNEVTNHLDCLTQLFDIVVQENDELRHALQTSERLRKNRESQIRLLRRRLRCWKLRYYNKAACKISSISTMPVTPHRIPPFYVETCNSTPP